jgi:gluconate 2-dehydrogenase gamma chain
MAKYSSDRRSVLKIFGAVGATCAYPFESDELFGQGTQGHQHEAAPAQADTEPHFFRGRDFATISRISDLIIPETDTPGALKAGVPAYIDLVVSRSTDHQMVVADGLRWLDSEGERTAGKKFLELTDKQQLSILEPLCELADNPGPAPGGRNVQFFALMKSLTADGFYTSRVGLIEELKYQGNRVRTAFPSCDPA